MRTWIWAGLAGMLLMGCGEEASEPPTAAELETGLFARRCSFDSCHGSAMQGGLSLALGDAHANLVGVDAQHAGATGLKRVVAGDPEQSFLIQKLEGPESGMGTRMPERAEPLPAAEIQRVRDWIAAGAPQ